MTIILRQNKEFIKKLKNKKINGVKIWSSPFLSYVNITKKEAIRLLKKCPYSCINISENSEGIIFID